MGFADLLGFFDPTVVGQPKQLQAQIFEWAAPLRLPHFAMKVRPVFAQMTNRGEFLLDKKNGRERRSGEQACSPSQVNQASHCTPSAVYFSC
jgi:hypothetical protein